MLPLEAPPRSWKPSVGSPAENPAYDIEDLAESGGLTVRAGTALSGLFQLIRGNLDLVPIVNVDVHVERSIF